MTLQIQNKLNDLENAAKQGKARRRRKPRAGTQRVTTLLGQTGTQLKHLVLKHQRPARLSLDSLQVKRNQESFRSPIPDITFDLKSTPAKPHPDHKGEPHARATISGIPSLPLTDAAVERRPATQLEDKRGSLDRFHTINERWKDEGHGEESESDVQGWRAREVSTKNAPGRASMDELERRAGGASGVLITFNKQGGLDTHVMGSESGTLPTVPGVSSDGASSELERASSNGKTQDIVNGDKETGASALRKSSVESADSMISSSRHSLELGWSRAMEVADKVENENLEDV